MRVHRRFASPVLVASLVVVLLAVGIAAAANGGHPPWADGSARVASADVSALGQEATTTTSLVPYTTAPAPPIPALSTSTTSPRTTTTKPRTSSTTTPTTPSVLVDRSTRANYGPTDPWAVDATASPGRTSWTGTSNGVAITVRTDKARPRAGEPVQFDIELSSATLACCGLAFLAGDGGIFEERTGLSCPGGGPSGPGTARFRTTHTYNRDGRWTFNVQAVTGNCAQTARYASLFGVIEIAPGTSTAQGPFQPQVRLAWSYWAPGHPEDPTWASMAGHVKDEDGWVSKLTLDWGDGTAPQRYPTPDPALCQTTLSGWPTPNEMTIVTDDAIHHYATPGTYLITLTAVTTACDGTSEPQTGVASYTWRVPASS